MASGEDTARRLTEALAVSAAAGTIASPVPHRRLLEMIVETAAHVLGAEAASLLLVDDDAEELVFEVATGEKVDELKTIRVPLGHGVAGTVALTGQPLAIAGEDNPAQAQDIAEQVGYFPRSLLCIPLYYGDKIIGVLELLDKRGAPTFGAEDVDSLRLFANQAAVAIEYSRTQGDVAALVARLLASTGHGDEADLRDQAESVAAAVSDDPGYRRTVELAQLVHEIAQRGETEFRSCRAILEAFAEYLRSHRTA
ncbi:MAG: GAF domain-containing protein [Thermoleophilia bacterium]|nr:GAF domain-containing protein [Thermoleophilia bacterium]